MIEIVRASDGSVIGIFASDEDVTDYFRAYSEELSGVPVYVQTSRYLVNA